MTHILGWAVLAVPVVVMNAVAYLYPSKDSVNRDFQGAAGFVMLLFYCAVIGIYLLSL